MKKSYLLILTLLLIIPFTVKASTEPAVLTVTAEVSGSKINYSGTTEDGVYAVMCKLYDSDNNEIDKLSSPVDSNSFADSFTVTKDGDYEVSCANYAGGEFKKASVTVEDATIYSITFNPNGGKVVDFDVPASVPGGSTFTLEEVTKDQVIPPSGKVFDAYEINGKRYDIGTAYTIKGDITLKLLWKSTSKGNPKTFDQGILGNYILLLASVIVGTLSIMYIKKLKRN